MAEVIARVRKEMQDRLNEIQRELASVEPLIAERARLEQVLATPPFAVQPDEPRPSPRQAGSAAIRLDSMAAAKAASSRSFRSAPARSAIVVTPVPSRIPRVACVARNRW